MNGMTELIESYSTANSTVEIENSLTVLKYPHMRVGLDKSHTADKDDSEEVEDFVLGR